MSDSPKIQAAIIDDDSLLVNNLKWLLSQPEHGIEVALTAASIDLFFDRFLRQAPRLDIILLDLDLEGEMSIHYLSQIKRMTNPAKIVMVTGYQEQELLIRAVEEGADGYFVKRPNPRPSLPEVVHLTHQGGAFLEPSISSGLLEAFQNRKTPLRSVNIAQIAEHCQANFSKREIAVLDGLLEEKSYQEIGDLNHISINTVRYYVKLIYQKLNVNSRKDLISKVLSL